MRVRPLRRRRLRTACPALLAMRFMKPCTRARLRVFGWYVRFGISVLSYLILLILYMSFKASLPLRRDFNNNYPLILATFPLLSKPFPQINRCSMSVWTTPPLSFCASPTLFFTPFERLWKTYNTVYSNSRS